MNPPEEEYITYVVVEQPNANFIQNSKQIKIMNTPEEERITYITAEPGKAGRVQGMNNPQLSSSDFGASGNLDKVRDLIFGNQMRDYEKRFSSLEERLLKECANLRDDTKKRLDSLEIYIKREVEFLTEGLKTEQNTRNEVVEKLGGNLEDITKSLEKKISHLDEQTSQKQRDLRQQILEQSNSLNDEIRQKYEAILSLVERELQEMRTDKIDRSTLATLFTQLAVHLNNEFNFTRNE